MNLVGEWEGAGAFHGIKPTGDVGFSGDTPFLFVVKEQKGRLFSGYKEITIPSGKKVREALSGVVAADNTTFYLAEHEDGMFIGEVLSPGKMMLYYVESGPTAHAAYAELEKKK